MRWGVLQKNAKNIQKKLSSEEADLHFGICSAKASLRVTYKQAQASKSLTRYAFVVAFENCKLPIEHQSLIGKHDKCLHHEHPVRQL